jgi:hypothetical protein
MKVRDRYRKFLLKDILPLCVSPMLDYSIGLQNLYSGMNAGKAAEIITYPG